MNMKWHHNQNTQHLRSLLMLLYHSPPPPPILPGPPLSLKAFITN